MDASEKDVSESSGSTIPVEEQDMENDNISSEVIIMGPPPPPVSIKRRRHRRNRNKKNDETTNSSTMDVSGTSDSLNSPVVSAERSVTQDKEFDRPTTSATMDLPMATAATAQQPMSDEIMDSQQEAGFSQGSTPMQEFLKSLVKAYEEELAGMKEELKRVKNTKSKSKDNQKM